MNTWTRTSRPLASFAMESMDPSSTPCRAVLIAGTITAQGRHVGTLADGRIVIAIGARRIAGRAIPILRRTAYG